MAGVTSKYGHEHVCYACELSFDKEIERLTEERDAALLRVERAERALKSNVVEGDEMQANDTVWSYADSEHAESLDGDCKTPEEAIVEAHREYEGREFWLYECRRCDVREFVPDPSDIIEIMRERACDVAGDAAEDFPDVSDAAASELEGLLDAWAERHCKAQFWTHSGCADAEYIAVYDSRRVAVEAS